MSALPKIDSKAMPVAIPALTDVLALGFGTSVATWSVAYICNLPALSASLPRWVGVALMLLCLFVGAFLAGKLTKRGWQGGLLSALISSVINLLILAAFWQQLSQAEGAPHAAIWLLGYLALSAVIGLIGGALGRTRRDTRKPDPAWLNTFAWVLLAAAALLIAKGGVVTSIGKQAAMSVPDWPTSFGSNMFLLPFGKMVGNVYFEHAHRLFGSLVGLTAIVFATLVSLSSSARLVKIVAWLSVVLVVIQGVLGGARVIDNETLLAIIHGILAQIFIGVTGMLTVMTAPLWSSGKPPKPYASTATERTIGWVTVGLLLLQLVIGAVLRHLNPPGMFHAHLTVACLALVAVITFGVRAWGAHPDVTPLRRSGLGLTHLVSLQFLLGLGAWASGVLSIPSTELPHSVWQVVIPTLHQTFGALLLAWVIRLLTLTYRLLKPTTD